ncbi:arginase family protein [Paenarthrobacter sp. GOM3]|uniref:arginase family protein n=1 Tax=Paenarthrobacter sp. GOM3 TaxID=2782567 RepID=UPI001BA99986|nr:arginase family protein [Paenarthrobacter sp. GOM3]WOH18379.1 arginase family protein [Paenarthrobacter sp. GOM3]
MAVLGVASSVGSPHHGAENGPAFLRAASRRYTWGYPDGCLMNAETGRTGFAAVDLGDIVPEGTSAPEVAEEIKSVVAGLDPRSVPCVIGGDHSITAGVISGLIARGTAPVRVVQFDQHLDVQLWEPATSRPLDPLFNTNVISHVGKQLGQRSVLQVGIDPFIAISASSSTEVPGRLDVSAGIIPVTSPLLRDEPGLIEALGSEMPTYVSIDVDVIQQAQMGSTGYPAHIGMDTGDLIRVLEVVLRHNPIVGLDVVEFSAERGAREPAVLSDAMRAADVLMGAISLLSS